MTKTKNKKPDFCPHGINKNEVREGFSFNGAISNCECCGYAFGHFGGIGTERCYLCKDKEFMKSIQPQIRKQKKWLKDHNVQSVSAYFIIG